MGIEVIENISHKYGKNPEFVLAGGGNTSFKTEENLYIKGSGTSLATITKDGFVKMSRAKLSEIWTKTYSCDKDTRESEVLADMMASRCVGEESKRPSVETLLHNLFTQPYVLHVHPTKVNGLTCSIRGEMEMRELFSGAIWIEETEPGYVLASKCRDRINEYESRTNEKANLLFLQNHGIFFAANSEEEMDLLVQSVMSRLDSKIKVSPNLTEVVPDYEKVKQVSPIIRMLYDSNGQAVVKFTLNKEIERLCESFESFNVLMRPMSPDHIVYCKSTPLFLESIEAEYIAEQFANFEMAHKYMPKVIFVKNVGMFAIGKNAKDACTVTDVWMDAVKISVYSKNFGGIRPMADEMVSFIENWEVESYRSKVALKSEGEKRFTGKIAIVTGGAKGFGKEIALSLSREGALIVVADKDIINGESTVNEIIKQNGPKSALFVYTDVTDEKSVESMTNSVIAYFGGIDVLINNAGIIKAGSIEETTKHDFEKILNVNYVAYFLCVKSVVPIMKLQRIINPEYVCDIIEINSKSGLCGSDKNFSYSGSKFGGIGLTQSFAIELAPFGIKVNAVCPGNYLDGELWSNPENGLLVQFLLAGKVKGAKTVEDVKKYYEGKVPLGRGCTAQDVAVAVCYAIEQKYETGQAIPVTGGQVMLK